MHRRQTNVYVGSQGCWDLIQMIGHMADVIESMLSNAILMCRIYENMEGKYIALIMSTLLQSSS